MCLARAFLLLTALRSDTDLTQVSMVVLSLVWHNHLAIASQGTPTSSQNAIRWSSSGWSSRWSYSQTWVGRSHLKTKENKLTETLLRSSVWRFTRTLQRWRIAARVWKISICSLSLIPATSRNVQHINDHDRDLNHIDCLTRSPNSDSALLVLQNSLASSTLCRSGLWPWLAQSKSSMQPWNISR